MVMVLCPANARVSLIVAPAVASHEQNVCRLQCHTYPVIFASTKQGTSHDRVSKRSCFRFAGSLWSSRGNILSAGFWPGGRTDSIAAKASALRYMVRAVPFFVGVRSMARRDSSNWDHVAEYCSVSRIPVLTD